MMFSPLDTPTQLLELELAGLFPLVRDLVLIQGTTG